MMDPGGGGDAYNIAEDPKPDDTPRFNGEPNIDLKDVPSNSATIALKVNEPIIKNIVMLSSSATIDPMINEPSVDTGDSGEVIPSNPPTIALMDNKRFEDAAYPNEDLDVFSNCQGCELDSSSSRKVEPKSSDLNVKIAKCLASVDSDNYSSNAETDSKGSHSECQHDRDSTIRDKAKTLELVTARRKRKLRIPKRGKSVDPDKTLPYDSLSCDSETFISSKDKKILTKSGEGCKRMKPKKKIVKHCKELDADNIDGETTSGNESSAYDSIAIASNDHDTESCKSTICELANTTMLSSQVAREESGWRAST